MITKEKKNHNSLNVNVLSAWSESATDLCCKNPSNVYLRQCGDSVLISVSRPTDCNWMFGVETNCVYFDTLKALF